MRDWSKELDELATFLDTIPEEKRELAEKAVRLFVRAGIQIIEVGYSAGKPKEIAALLYDLSTDFLVRAQNIAGHLH